MYLSVVRVPEDDDHVGVLLGGERNGRVALAAEGPETNDGVFEPVAECDNQTGDEWTSAYVALGTKVPESPTGKSLRYS